MADNRKRRQDGGKGERITLDIEKGDSDFMRRYSAFKTILAKLTGREGELPPEGKWTRKTLAESYIEAQCDAERESIERMIAACGELPDPNDKGEMERYVARVYVWSERDDEKQTPKK